MTSITRRLVLMVALLGVASGPVHAQASYGIVLHVTSTAYSGCDALDEALLICDGMNPTGRPDEDQFVWVFTFGANAENIEGWGGTGDPGISAMQFGITYDATVDVMAWTLCTGGLDLPQQDPIPWPASGTGNAMTWPGACYDSPSPEDFTKCGYFITAAGSEGFMVVRGDPRAEGRVWFTDCEVTIFEIPPENHESGADVGGTAGGGWATCAPLPTPVRETTWSAVKDAYLD